MSTCAPIGAAAAAPWLPAVPAALVPPCVGRGFPGHLELFPWGDGSPGGRPGRALPDAGGRPGRWPGKRCTPGRQEFRQGFDGAPPAGPARRATGSAGAAENVGHRDSKRIVRVCTPVRSSRQGGAHGHSFSGSTGVVVGIAVRTSWSRPPDPPVRMRRPSCAAACVWVEPAARRPDRRQCLRQSAADRPASAAMQDRNRRRH